MHSFFPKILGPATLLCVAGWSCRLESPTSTVRATPAERAVIGVGNSYNPLTQDANALVEQLDSDAQRRREAGWHVATEITAPVTIHHATAGDITLPKFLTWYDSSEVRSLLRKYYTLLSADEKASGKITDEHLKLAGTLLNDIVTNRDIGGWTDDLVKAAANNLAHGSSRAGANVTLNGNLFSPEFVLHLLRNVLTLRDCTQDKLDSFKPDLVPSNPNNFALCFDSEFPTAAVMFKPIIVASTGALAVFDTDSSAVAKNMLNATGWQAARSVDKSVIKDKIFTLSSELLNSPMYLVGFHAVTKDVRDWLWASWWWHDQPQTDLGADRPAALLANGAVWGNYKMCIASNFAEKDAAPGAHFKTTFADLAASLDEIAAQLGKFKQVTGKSEDMTGHQWCANPYIEAAFEAPTNCIGCHQNGHLGFAITLSVRQARQNFPTDFSFATMSEFRPAIAGLVRHDAGGGSAQATSRIPGTATSTAVSSLPSTSTSTARASVSTEEAKVP